VAIGAPQNDGNSTNSGHVRVYQLSGSAWTQLGADINGEMVMDHSGSVSLSADGSRLASGAPQNDGNGRDSGHVRVYQWSGGTWNRLGADIEGEADGDRFGASVSLSADGNWLASGAIYNDGNGINSGHVRVFTLSEWQNQMAFNGLFYDPANPGHGFDFNVHETGLTVYYYGHTSSGERLWLVSGLYIGDIEFDVRLELEMFEINTGVFGSPVEPATSWGTITITLTDCDSGYASFSGVDGDIEMDLVRLVGLAGMDCGLAP
jgi:hypothetical protein